ncbi:MAG: hypothetical protein WBM71_16570 [Sedimenticolaceae bacterium]
MKRLATIVTHWTKPALTLSVAVLLSGCLPAKDTITVFDNPTIRPGDWVTCENEPCSVYFETPAGSGTHNILQDGTIKAGVAVGGQRVFLGEYYGGTQVFHVEGTDLPEAHLQVIRSW